jgi:hypothetical protein
MSARTSHHATAGKAMMREGNPGGRTSRTNPRTAFDRRGRWMRIW